jgi:hypothetical protein
MINKRSMVLAVFAVVLAIIAGWLAGRTTAAQVSASGAAAPQQQPAAPDQKVATWEYRVISTGVNSIVKYTVTDNKGRSYTNQGPYLEEEINKLAAQGFVVDSFQVATTTSGSGGASYFALSGSSQIVVILKRIKN